MGTFLQNLLEFQRINYQSFDFSKMNLKDIHTFVIDKIGEKEISVFLEIKSSDLINPL